MGENEEDEQSLYRELCPPVTNVAAMQYCVATLDQGAGDELRGGGQVLFLSELGVGYGGTEGDRSEGLLVFWFRLRSPFSSTR